MSATIKELQRKREAEDLLTRTRQANERTGVLALLAAFETGKAALETGEARTIWAARSEFLTARAGANKLVAGMYKTPLCRLLSGFLEISHVWMGANANLAEDRRQACATLDDLAQQLRAAVGE